ncbi:MAG: toll/interleukin-1 receptor domain-containing protein [Tepidisphaerales bacterium]
MRVFISHAAQDTALAIGLRDELAKAGMAVWNPEDEIYPGDNWAKKTGEALEHSEIMVALVTRHAVESGPLRNDVQFALTSGNYGGRVVPVLVDYPTFTAGTDVPWILLKLDPVLIESAQPDFQAIVGRVRDLAERDMHVAR